MERDITPLYFFPFQYLIHTSHPGQFTSRAVSRMRPYVLGPVAGSTIENVHFIKNNENKRRAACVMSGARKHNHARVETVKTTLVVENSAKN